MGLYFDPDVFDRAIATAGTSTHHATIMLSHSKVASTSIRCPVPGLDTLTDAHVAVIHGASGSAQEILQSYLNQITWMEENLQATKSAITLQDQFHGTAFFDMVGKIKPITDGAVKMIPRPEANFPDFPFPSPSAGGHSLYSLSLDFASTNSSYYHGMAKIWRELAKRATTIADDIRMMSREIADNNRGELINAASARISEISEAARAFSANANTMAASVETLVSIHSQGQSMVDSAIAELDAIEDPQERQAAHASLLDSFLVSFDNMLREGVPPINNLMQLPSSGGNGGSTIALGGSKHGGKSLSETSTPTITGAGAGSGGATAGAGVASGAQFGQVNSNLDQLKGIGTQGAGTGAGVGGVAPGTVTGPQAPQAPQFGGMGAGGMGTGGVGGMGAPRRLPPGTLDSSTGRMNGIVTSTGAGAGTGTGTGAGSGAGAGAGNGLSAVRGGMGTGGMIAPGGFGTHGGHGGAGGTGTRGGIGTGGGAGGIGRGVTGGGVPGGGAHGGSGGSQGGSIVRRSWSDGTIGRPPAGSPGVGSGAGAGAAGTGSGSGGGRPPMMGGVPMGAGRGGGEQNNQRPRPKSLNDIEREDNLRALLGPPIMWVPMAIYPPSSKKED